MNNHDKPHQRGLNAASDVFDWDDDDFPADSNSGCSCGDGGCGNGHEGLFGTCGNGCSGGTKDKKCCSTYCKCDGAGKYNEALGKGFYVCQKCKKEKPEDYTP